MNNRDSVTGLRSIELGVTNLTQSVGFYSQVWGLDPVCPTATPSICAPMARSTTW